MTWTYEQPVEDGWPDPIHEVRYLIGDLAETKYSPSDEVLSMYVKRWENAHPDADAPNVYYVAAQAAEHMSQGLAGAVTAVSSSDGTGSVSRTYAGEAGRLSKLAEWLWGMAGEPREGGMSGFGRVTRDVPPRQFALGHLDAPGTGLGAHRPAWLELER